MKFTTIRIEGSILSADILDKIEQGDLGGQLPKDFGFNASVKVKDEIARAWADACDLWKIFKRHRSSLADNLSGTTETRKYWILPLLDLLGYELEVNKEWKEVNEKKYPISHSAKQLDDFPIHIVGFKDSLDKKRENSITKMSPHALLQEYINLTEHLYGIVTNGISLRLLRDSSRLIKLSFIEFDLESMMDEDHFADFAILFRLLHSSHLPKNQELSSESIIEKYHQDALDSGSRIREGLSEAVKNGLIHLANGFLKYPANAHLRQAFENQTISSQDYYHALLKLIYRLLFLMVIEERNLVYSKQSDNNKRSIYYNYYSIKRLRKLCEKIHISEQNRYEDLWISLKNNFKLFETENFGSHLDIKPLAGDLFSNSAIGILNECRIDNATLLFCIKNLSIFTNNSGQKMRVNYASLNVEEFGSVYEGLLESSPAIKQKHGIFEFYFVKGSERSKTGSHYTPDELVSPLITHSLDYIIADCLKKQSPENALLSIKLCDVASGSGHILLNAARRIGSELAKVRTKEDQPSPSAYREGVRDAIKNCIYGVDKNPLAVELCKVSLWLEAHIPGEPLNFLDHHIKYGDSIVGLAHKEELFSGIANEAFKKLQGDDAETAKFFSRRNKSELESKERQLELFAKPINQNILDIAKLFKNFELMPEKTPEQIQAKEKAYKNLTSGANWWRLKNLADIKVAQFFIPKIKENEYALVTSEKYRDYLSGIAALEGRTVGKITAIAFEKLFFHWFLEFPEIFLNGGFDCILGNPPFLGGQKLSGAFGANFLEYIKYAYKPAGSCDLVTYFFRRIFEIIKPKGFQALIATNTIAQGGSREGGLEVIIKQGGNINFAVRSMKWPGLAAVEVSLISIYKGSWNKNFILNNKPVSQITAYLDDTESLGNPFPLIQNADKSFQGSIVLGKGFILEPEQAKALIEKNPKNKDVLFPYLNGEDLNTNPDQSPSRWVINFFDWDKEKCRKEYPDCFEIVERLVKPERNSYDETKNSWNKSVKQFWWQFGAWRKGLDKAIASLDRVLVHTRVTKIHALIFYSDEIVFSDATVVFAYQKNNYFCILQSSLHENWAWKYSSTMKGDRRYSPSDCFETFPFPQNLTSEMESALENIGSEYYEHRKNFMLKYQLGLTKTYNQFHNEKLSIIEEGLDNKEIEKRYGKETLNLYKHLSKAKNTGVFKELVSDIMKFRDLHKTMDGTVLKAYGWMDINLCHGFYEMDYLPENDRIRYSISPEARREILKRLLLLNHEIHKKEIGQERSNNKPSRKRKKTSEDEQMSIF
ncbi:MAG: restriction endonuclease [Desulfamplus sp.]|nr:restriction endonuclease [Desulfamplus sp.]